MSILSFAANSAFTLRTRKSNNADPEDYWFNTYEIWAFQAGDIDKLQTLAEACTDFEAALLTTSATVNQYTLSTWQPDSEPYDPFAFVTVPQSKGGARSLVAEQDCSTETCLYLRRTVESGRTGKLFLRNSLFKSEIISTAGDWRLNGPVSMTGLVEDSLDNSGFGPYFTGEANADGLAIVMIGATIPEAFTRYVTGLNVAGVRTVNRDHKYFDVETVATLAMVEAFAKNGVTIQEGQRVKIPRRLGKPKTK